MSSKPDNQENTKDLNKALTKLCFGMFMSNLLLTYLGAFPTNPGYLLAILSLLAFTLGFIPSSHIYEVRTHLINIYLALSPVWTFFSDPCALVFAQSHTIANVMFICVQQKKKSTRILYIALMIASWICVWLVKDTLIQECKENATENLGRDIMTILLFNGTYIEICKFRKCNLVPNFLYITHHENCKLISNED